MKKLFASILVVISVFTLVSCKKDKTDNLQFDELRDFVGKNIGIISGTTIDLSIQEAYGKMNISYFNDEATGIEALRKGTLDAYLVSKPTGMLISSSQSDISMYPDPFIDDPIGFGFAKGNPLCEEFSEVIEKYLKDGTIEALDEKWLYGDYENRIIDEELYNGPENPKGTLNFYCLDLLEPMIYHTSDNRMTGHDTELALLICNELGYKINFVPTKLEGLLIAIKNGNADFIGGELSVTDERKESVDFTTPYYHGGIYALVRSETLVHDIDLNEKGTTISICIDVSLDPKDYYPNAEVLYVKNETDGLLSITSGQADAFIERDSLLKIIRSNGIENIHIHSDGYVGETGEISAAISPVTGIPDAEKKINEFIKIMQEDGTLEEMQDRWLVEKNYQMPDLPKCENPKYTVKIGTTGLATPYTFIQDGTLTGLEVEFAYRFAYWLGAEVEFTMYDWDSIIIACSTGKIDYAISNIYVTDEKRESVIFSDPYSTYSLVLFVMDQNTATDTNFFENLGESFNKTFIREGRYKIILQGLLTTVVISLGAALLGILIGALLCLLRRSRIKTVKNIANGFCYVLSGIPAVVTLMIVYFIIFAKSSMSPIISAIITFGLLFGITFSSIMSAGIDSVDKSQWDAAKALGFNRWQTFFMIILPQTIKIILPLFRGEFVSMMKLTSIVGYISIQDLTKAGDIIRSRTFEAFFPLIAVALVYFILSACVIHVLGKIEIKADYSSRKKKVPSGIDTNSNRNINISVNIPQNTGEEIISISHLRKEFPGVVPISDITASIKSGDVISVIGPSGTGKSTFLRLLNGLETPTSGKIVVFGRDIGDKNTNLNLIRKRMNMVFQSFNLFNNLTVLENVMIGPITLNKMTKQEAYDNAMYLLKTVGVANKALEMPENLSGGQKQRVAIARALAMNPKVILLDEPTSALDPAMTGEVSEVIRYLSDLGMTMIIVTHEMKLAKTVSKRIFYLDQGELYEDGTPEQIFENPKRTRTRLFIKKLKSVAIVVDSPDYDYISAKQTLLEFSVRCKLDEEITENLVKIFNLILKHNEFIPEAVDAHKLHVIAEFDSDNNKASMTFVRECESFNMIDCLGDDRDAVFSMVENVEYSYEDGKNTLKLSNIK